MESYRVNGSSGFEFIFGFLEVSDIPNIEFFIFTTGGNQVSIEWRDSNSINVIIMSLESKSDGVGDVPYLEPSVPTDSNKIWFDTNILSLGRKSDLTNPISMIILLSSVF